MEITTSYRSIPSIRTGASPRLGIISDLLDDLHHAGINYCHWKSNEHLGASMSGDTDLDMLFDAEQREKVRQLLTTAGYIKFAPVSFKRYHDIEDFLGIDFTTGKLVHVHTHFKLTMGEPYLKGYQLRAETAIINTKVFDDQYGIYTTEPGMETVLLFCRQALKLRHRDRLRIMLGKGGSVASNFIREFVWLKQRCNTQQVMAATHLVFPGDESIARICCGDLNKVQLAKLSPLLRKALRKSRLYSPVTALLIRWQREILIRARRRLAAKSAAPVVHKRVHAHGLVVAVIGADGSGKSTVIKDLQQTLGKKLDVYSIYFGNGGYTTLASRFEKLISRLRKTGSKTARGLSDKRAQPGSSGNVKALKAGAVRTFIKCLSAFELALVKQRNLRRMIKAHHKGMLVICDRFPQQQVFGYNDGPHLNHLLQSGNWLFRFFARREQSIFSLITAHHPAIVFKLIADARLVESRKPGQTSIEVLERKIRAIRELQFSPACKVITVDASQTLDDVLQTVKSGIWKEYLSFPNEEQTTA